MIADRMGQFASATAPEMLEQARRLSHFMTTRTAPIWRNGSDMRAVANMVSKISKPERSPVPLAELAGDIARRRAEYEARTGTPCEIPRNSGERRTASKRALLKAIEQAGGKW